MVSIATALALFELVSPSAIPISGHVAGRRRRRTCRFCYEDLALVGCGWGGRREREVGGPLDGRFIGSSQDSEAGGLLLGLLELLLSLQLLLKEPLEVLLKTAKRGKKRKECYTNKGDFMSEQFFGLLFLSNQLSHNYFNILAIKLHLST